MNMTVNDYIKNLIRTSPFQQEANLRYSIWRINNPCFGINLMKYLTDSPKLKLTPKRDEEFEWNAFPVHPTNTIYVEGRLALNAYIEELVDDACRIPKELM